LTNNAIDTAVAGFSSNFRLSVTRSSLSTFNVCLYNQGDFYNIEEQESYGNSKDDIYEWFG
jgi:hypothetical protein